MKGSITFKFAGHANDSRVHVVRQGELDRVDLEVVVALVNEDILLKKLIESGEIKPTPSDPTGRGQLREMWGN